MDRQGLPDRDKVRVELFARLPLFEALSHGEVEDIAGWVPEKSFGRGQHLYAPAYGENMFFVLL